MSETIETIDLDMWLADRPSEQVIRYRQYIGTLMEQYITMERRDMECLEQWLFMLAGRVRRLEDQLEERGIDIARKPRRRQWWFVRWFNPEQR